MLFAIIKKKLLSYNKNNVKTRQGLAGCNTLSLGEGSHVAHGLWTLYVDNTQQSHSVILLRTCKITLLIFNRNIDGIGIKHLYPLNRDL
jgi:hypothetical protein